MRRFHFPQSPRATLHLPDLLAHPSGRIVENAAVFAAIVAVCALLVLAN